MRKVSKDYIVYLVVVYIVLAVLIMAMIFDYVSYFQFLGAMWFILGMAFLYWGRYQIKKREAFDTAIWSTYFVRKKDMEYYDKERMIEDMGKFSLFEGILFAVCGAWIFFAEMFIDNVSIVMGVLVVLLIILLIASISFMVIHRRSKYLKDPNIIPPKGRGL